MKNTQIKEHEEYTIFTQLSMFEPPIKPPRNSWEYYGISKNRYKTLTKYIQSGKYDFIAVQAAKLANEMIAEHILLSIKKDLSYDVLQRLWDLEKIKRMPCGRSDFYGWRRYFYHIFDERMREYEIYSHKQVCIAKKKSFCVEDNQITIFDYMKMKAT